MGDGRRLDLIDQDEDDKYINDKELQKRTRLHNIVTVGWLKKRCAKTASKRYLHYPEEIRKLTEIKRIFNIFDEDDSKKLDLDEFLTMMNNANIDISLEKMQYIYSFSDKDRDNALTLDEFKDLALSDASNKAFTDVMTEIRQREFSKNRENGSHQPFIPLTFKTLLNYLIYRTKRDKLYLTLKDKEAPVSEKLKTLNELLKLNSQTDTTTSEGLEKAKANLTAAYEEFSEQQPQEQDDDAPIAEISRENDNDWDEENNNQIEEMQKEDAKDFGYLLKEIDKQEKPKKEISKEKDKEKTLVAEEKAFKKEIADLVNKAREGVLNNEKMDVLAYDMSLNNSRMIGKGTKIFTPAENSNMNLSHLLKPERNRDIIAASSLNKSQSTNNALSDQRLFYLDNKYMPQNSEFKNAAKSIIPHRYESPEPTRIYNENSYSTSLRRDFSLPRIEQRESFLGLDEGNHSKKFEKGYDSSRRSSDGRLDKSQNHRYNKSDLRDHLRYERGSFIPDNLMGEIHNKDSVSELPSQKRAEISVESESIRRAIINNNKDFDSLMRQTQEIVDMKKSHLITQIFTVGHPDTRLPPVFDAKMPQHKPLVKTRITEKSLIMNNNGIRIPPIHSNNRGHMKIIRRSAPGFSNLLSEVASQMLNQDNSHRNIEPKPDLMEAALQGRSVFKGRKFV